MTLRAPEPLAAQHLLEGFDCGKPAPRRSAADVFVTGDQRVLGWHPRAAMQILSPRQAWQLVVLTSL